MKNLLCIVSYLFVSQFILGNTEVNSVSNPTVEPASISIVAKRNTQTIQWPEHANKNYLVVATEGSVNNNPPQFVTEYEANSQFGKGSKVGNSFIVYKGSDNSATISGLKRNAKYTFTIYELTADGFYFSDKSILLTQGDNLLVEKLGPLQTAAVVTCVCPPIAGVTCTLTGTTNTGSSVASAAGCPHVGYCDGPGVNNSWSSAAGTGTLQYRFSTPVSAATLRANSVNTNDYATISAAGGSGGALSISGVVCMGVSGLVIGPLSVALSYGGVSWTVNSTGSYTVVTALNTGAQSGWVSACPTAITPVPLPIELVSLKGICEADEIVLRWQTLSEKNNSYYSVERSFDTENFEVIGKVAGAGNSNSLLNYNFSDARPLSSLAYYRLKQTDLTANTNILN